MKRLSIISVIVLWLLQTSAAAQYAWRYVTREQAIEKVRQIVGDPAAAVDVLVLQPPDTLPGVAWHVLRCGQQEFRICAHSLHNWSVHIERTEAPYSESPAVTREQAIQIAEQFKNAHFPYPELLTDVRVNPIIANDVAVSYRIRFIQRHPNGVFGPSSCLVIVNTITGEVDLGVVRYYPVLTSLTPVLTPEQAFAAAAQQLSLSTPEAVRLAGLSVTKPDPFGAQTLVYELLIWGQEPDGNYNTFACSVDAFTGALLWHDIVMGEKGRGRAIRARSPAIGRPLWVHWKEAEVEAQVPPMKVGERVYVWSRWLGSGLLGGAFRVHYDRGFLVLEGSGRVWRTRVGSRAVVSGDRQVVLSAPVLRLGNRVYLPAEALERLTGLKVEVDGQVLKMGR